MIDRRHLVRTGLLLVLTSVLYFALLGRLPFHGTGEPREGLEVQEEIARGEWILPMRNGLELPSKPPLFHWLGGLSALALGRVDELAVRLPSAVLATLAVFAIYWYAARRWDKSTALYAACVLATNFEWMRAARNARVDMTFNACLAGAFVAFGMVADGERPSTAGLLVFGFCMGLAALAKGPLGIIVPLLVAIGYFAVRGKLGAWRVLRPVVALVPAVALPACWYGLAIWQGGEAFIRKQILVENLQTFFSWTGDPGTPKHSFLYFIPAFLTGFMPWSPLLLFTGAHLWTRRQHLHDEGVLYPLVWFGVVFAFFTVAAGKRSVYMLPAYPAAALLMGWWWGQLSAGMVRASPAARRWLQLAAAVSVVVVLIAIGALLAEALGAAPLEWLRPFLHHKDQANLVLVHDIAGRHRSAFVFWALASAACVSAFGWALRHRHWSTVFLSVVLLASGTTLMVNAVLEPELAAQWTPRPLIAAVRSVVRSPEDIGFDQGFDYGAVFYWGDRIPVVSTTISEIRRQGWPRYLLLWESACKSLSSADREALEIISRGNESGSDETDRLVFARVKPYE